MTNRINLKDYTKQTKNLDHIHIYQKIPTQKSGRRKIFYRPKKKIRNSYMIKLNALSFLQYYLHSFIDFLHNKTKKIPSELLRGEISLLKCDFGKRLWSLNTSVKAHPTSNLNCLTVHFCVWVDHNAQPVKISNYNLIEVTK